MFSAPSQRRLRFFSIFLAAACAHAISQAQTQTPPNSPDETEIVVLPEFTVSQARDGDYEASDSLTASRVKMEIRDLPYNVNVVTAEFMQDFAAYDLGEELAYTSAFTHGQASTGSEYVLRGVAQSAQLRNGLRGRNAPIMINRERKEVIKGPAAAIFGQCDPGGIINIITKRPKTKFGATARVALGDYSLRQAEIDVSGPAGGDVYYRLSLANYYREFNEQYAFTDQLMAAFALMKKFGAHTALTFEYEYVDTDKILTDPLPYYYNSTTKKYTHFATDLAHFNTNTKDGFWRSEQSAFFLTFEHRFNRAFSMRTAASYGTNTSKTHYYSNTSFLLNANDDKGWYVNSRVAQYDRQPQSSWSAQNDFLARFRTGSIEHQALLTVDILVSSAERLNLRLPSNSPLNRAKLYVNNPDYYLAPFSETTYTNRNTAYDNVVATYGSYLRYQISALQGRLIAMAGIRYDYIDHDLRDTITITAPVIDKYSVTAVTPQFGFNFKINEAFTFYANRANSFKPTPPARRAEKTGRLKNEEGLGVEAGIKGSLFNKRLNFTIAAYRIDRENVETTEMELVPTGAIDPNTGEPILEWDDVRASLGRQRSLGVELDFNWKMTKNIQLFGGANYVDSQVIRAGVDLDQIGRQPRSSPQKRAAAGMRYAFPKNFLSGLVFTAGIVYVDDMAAASPNSGTGLIRDADNNIIGSALRDLRIPSYASCDAGVNYRFKIARRSTHRMQLNIKNFLNRTYVSSNGRLGDRCAVVGSYTISY